MPSLLALGSHCTVPPVGDPPGSVHLSSTERSRVIGEFARILIFVQWVKKMDEKREKELIDHYVDRILELEEDIELVESKISGKGRSALLRVYIYKSTGVTVDDCIRINKRLSRELEYDTDLQEAFTIEVSSPGLDRKLQTRRDFERVVGEVLRLEVSDADDRRRTIRGLLTEVGDDTLLLDPPPDGGGESFRVKLAKVHEGKVEVLL